MYIWFKNHSIKWKVFQNLYIKYARVLILGDSNKVSAVYYRKEVQLKERYKTMSKSTRK